MPDVTSQAGQGGMHPTQGEESMGENDKSVTNASALLAERRKYEGWLAALHERRATTPERVYARVRADYEARLEAVVANLASNADALDTQVRDLAERVKSLAAEIQSVEDSRAEAELRAHVGELAQDDWEAASRDADQAIASLGDERRKAEEELESLRELLTAARTPTPAMSSVAIAPPAPQADATAAVGAEEGSTPSSEPSPARATESTPEPEVAAEQAAGGDAPLVSDESPAASGQGTDFDELAFLRDVTGVTPAQPMEAVAASGEDAVPSQPERPVNDTLGLVLPSDVPAITAPRRPSTEAPIGTSPTVSKPEVGRQGKTLKCTDCGSMNYPTEWYCERCGAELSAL